MPQVRRHSPEGATILKEKALSDHRKSKKGGGLSSFSSSPGRSGSRRKGSSSNTMASLDLQVIDDAFGKTADLYTDVLQVSTDATQEEIQLAYFDRRSELFTLLAKIDSKPQSESMVAQRFKAERKMDSVVLAVRVLGDPALRGTYDQLRPDRVPMKQQLTVNTTTTPRTPSSGGGGERRPRSSSRSRKVQQASATPAAATAAAAAAVTPTSTASAANSRGGGGGSSFLSGVVVDDSDMEQTAIEMAPMSGIPSRTHQQQYETSKSSPRNASRKTSSSGKLRERSPKKKRQDSNGGSGGGSGWFFSFGNSNNNSQATTSMPATEIVEKESESTEVRSTRRGRSRNGQISSIDTNDDGSTAAASAATSTAVSTVVSTAVESRQETDSRTVETMSTIEKDVVKEESTKAASGVFSCLTGNRTLKTISDEISGACEDTLVSVDQVFNAFTLTDKDIKAVTKKIDKAKRQLDS